MIHKTFETASGIIHYWLHMADGEKETLVFLPGLTADHRLFEKQTGYFIKRCNVLVWDAPAHGASWPFRLDFTLEDKARWLNGILERENIARPVIVGQSMGGYVGQAFARLYPDKLKGFVAIGSAPLGRKYISRLEIWLLKKVEPLYHFLPWKLLLWSGSGGTSATEYGRKLMRTMMETYTGDKKRYARISGHGSKILAHAMEKDISWAIGCPALLLCGRKDRAGSAIRYNKAWHRDTGIPLHWIPQGGHNANADQPEMVNRLIGQLVKNLQGHK